MLRPFKHLLFWTGNDSVNHSGSHHINCAEMRICFCFLISALSDSRLQYFHSCCLLISVYSKYEKWNAPYFGQFYSSCFHFSALLYLLLWLLIFAPFYLLQLPTCFRYSIVTSVRPILGDCICAVIFGTLYKALYLVNRLCFGF